MFLLLNNEEKVIGACEKIQSICEQTEQRIQLDFEAFKRTPGYNNEQYDLDDYLGLKIQIVDKEKIGWVLPDFVYQELIVGDFLNESNSGIIKHIAEYNLGLTYVLA
ncbi:MAG: hypothetical protein R2685_10550 [Candidatus Nitrosocosmicus sp.]|nr:hypothetical protein [Candidatus Nitrosocosmicus sp.]